MDWLESALMNVNQLRIKVNPPNPAYIRLVWHSVADWSRNEDSLRPCGSVSQWAVRSPHAMRSASDWRNGRGAGWVGSTTYSQRVRQEWRQLAGQLAPDQSLGKPVGLDPGASVYRQSTRRPIWAPSSVNRVTMWFRRQILEDDHRSSLEGATDATDHIHCLVAPVKMKDCRTFNFILNYRIMA